MISQFLVKDFKSIQELEMDLGRVTVLIGANGCGKSNILEAIAMCSAAAGNKLDNEFLASRGIRVPDNPRFMRSAFEAPYTREGIYVGAAGRSSSESRTDASTQEQLYGCLLQNNNDTPYSNWSKFAVPETLDSQVALAVKMLKDLEAQLEVKPQLREQLHQQLQSFSASVDQIMHTSDQLKQQSDEIKQIVAIPPDLLGFLIYSPENTSLRTFETEGQIQPLGIKGEGLFKLLTVLSSPENKEQLDEIKKRLTLLDWFDDFEVMNGNSTGARTLNIKDRFLDDSLSYFTQKSANEGFLFLLFYFALFISKETPSFFAIDNIDASLNPKLCSQLMKELVDLAETYSKQAIVTTHNPAILDGLDLNDDEQRLFVVSRNKLGHTKVKRITKQASLPDQKPVRLSEAFLRGYLGGLPGNF